LSAWDPNLYQKSHAFVWELGRGLLDLLGPRPGERILDLGCGTGQLSAEIAAAEAYVVGLDSSADMLGRARKSFPTLDLVQGDATRFAFNRPFDAVFSNAVLHWVPDAEAAARCIAGALRPGGRFIAEFGGKGNCAAFLAGAEATAAATGLRFRNPWYYPDASEYEQVLSLAGLRVVNISLFDRLTPLEGESGMRDWVRMFAKAVVNWRDEDAEAFLAKLEIAVRPALYREGKWWMDYRRLRVHAVRL